MGLLIGGPGLSWAQEKAPDSELYHRAVDYCRTWVPRPMALSADRRLLCFDGWVDEGMDLSPARDLKQFGLFVVRSFGGHDATAVALSHLLRDRHATVVVYDFCVWACANYFSIASDQTYVVEGALVVWRILANDIASCPSFVMPSDQGPKRIKRAPCPDASPQDVAKYYEISSEMTRFYAERTLDPMFELPPQSFYVRKDLKNFYDQNGIYPNAGWILNPRYLKAFKTKIVYESYPGSQEEVDAIAARLHLGAVIYDP